MEALRRREVAQLVAFVHDAAELESRLPFPPELVERLRELVPGAEIVTYCELDWERRRVRYEADQLAWARDPDVEDAYWELVHQHAVCEYFARTGDFRPRRMSDLLPPREWRSRELYNVVFRPYQYELEVRIPSSRTGCTRTFLFHAQKGDLGERDRLVLELLRPHLERVVDRFERSAALEADLPSHDANARSSSGSSAARRTPRSQRSSGCRRAPCASTSRTHTASSASARARPPSRGSAAISSRSRSGGALPAHGPTMALLL